MAATRRRRLSAAVASLLLALLVVLPVAVGPTTAAATPFAPEAPGDSRVTITSITPVVEGDGVATVRGTVTNTGSTTLSGPRVAVVQQEAGTGRSDIADWTKGDAHVSGTALAATTLDDVAAGGSASFTLEVEGSDLLPQSSAGAAWVSVQTDSTAVHTFVGVQRTKEYEPLQILWGMPLLLPDDRRLWGTSREARSSAWQEAVGSDSRIAALTSEEPADDEFWVLDPSLLDVPADGEDIATAERETRTRAAESLREQLVGSRTLVLPDADADVAAGAESKDAARLVRARVADGTRVAQELGARSDVLWPADGLATGERAEALHELRPTGVEPTLLVRSTSLVPEGFTATGGDRTTAGSPVVVSDGPIADLVEGLSSADDVTLARQQLVAETAAVLGERPGTPRTIVVVPDRSSTPSVEAYEQLRASTDRIPWLEGGDLASVLDDAAAAEPARTARTPGQIDDVTAGAATPSAVLSQDRSRRIVRDSRSMATFAAVRRDGTAWRSRMQASLQQLTSTRWREDRYGFVRLHDDVERAVTLDADDLVVSSGDVNFFADSGRLQISITNNTDVQLEDLRVHVTPGNHSLRVDGDPDPVTIGPGGQQTVTVQATALAAGQVPVNVAVTTPGGHAVAEPATLHVKVRPTGDSIYWVIGGAAVLLLAAGTWRTVRGGRRARAAAPEGSSSEGQPESSSPEGDTDH